MRINLIAPTTQLAVGWLTMFIVGTELFVMSPLLPFLAADLGLSTPLAGSSVSVFSVAYMLSSLFWGTYPIGSEGGGCSSALSLPLPRPISLPHPLQACHRYSGLGSLPELQRRGSRHLFTRSPPTQGQPITAPRDWGWLYPVSLYLSQSGRQLARWRVPRSAGHQYLSGLLASVCCWPG